MSARIDPGFLQPASSTLLPAATSWAAEIASALYRRAGMLAARLAVVASLLAAAALAVSYLDGTGAATHGGGWTASLFHLPAAWTALVVYLLMAACAMLSLAAGGALPALAMRALMPAGAAFAFLSLWTAILSDGAADGLALSGAQLTGEAVLLVMYAGFALLRFAVRDAARADRACAALVLVGVFNLPIIYFSVQWWVTLHNARMLGAASSSAMAGGVLAAVLLMALAFCAYAVAAALARLRSLLPQDGAAPAGLSSQEQA
jgi:heme exporter protein C